MDNPPAFPLHPQAQGHSAFAGMTLRDWFAGQVRASGDASEHYQCRSGETRAQAEARYCYERADAMLAARSQSIREGMDRD